MQKHRTTKRKRSVLLKDEQRYRLLHGYAPDDRKKHETLLHARGGRIVVATQAVEAGLEVSARTLITELAPWSSLVQRFGRCNRRGESKGNEARVFWINIQAKDEKDKVASLCKTAASALVLPRIFRWYSSCEPIQNQTMVPSLIRPRARCESLIRADQ